MTPTVIFIADTRGILYFIVQFRSRPWWKVSHPVVQDLFSPDFRQRRAAINCILVCVNLISFYNWNFRATPRRDVLKTHQTLLRMRALFSEDMMRFMASWNFSCALWAQCEEFLSKRKFYDLEWDATWFQKQTRDASSGMSWIGFRKACLFLHIHEATLPCTYINMRRTTSSLIFQTLTSLQPWDLPSFQVSSRVMCFYKPQRQPLAVLFWG